MARAKTPGLKKFNIYLATPVVAALDHLAVLRNTTRAELVRNCLRGYVKVELLAERDQPELEDLMVATAEGTGEVQLTLQLQDVDPNTDNPDEFQPEHVAVEETNDKPIPRPPSGTIRMG